MKNIPHQLRRRALDNKTDAFNYRRNRLKHCLQHFKGRKGYHLGESLRKASALYLHRFWNIVAVDRADAYFYAFCGALTDKNIVFASDIPHYRLVKLVSRDLD